MVLGFDVQEPEEQNKDARINAFLARMHQHVAGLHSVVADMVSTGKFNGRPFQAAIPHGMAFISPHRTRARKRKRAAEGMFMSGYNLTPAPDPGYPFRWALTRQATKQVVFFDLPGPIEYVPEDKLSAIAKRAIDSMLKAQKEN